MRGSYNLQAVFNFCDSNIPCRVPLLSGKFKCPAYSLAGISGLVQKLSPFLLDCFATLVKSNELNKTILFIIYFYISA